MWYLFYKKNQSYTVQIRPVYDYQIYKIDETTFSKLNNYTK